MLAFPPEMGILNALWFLLVAIWVLLGSGWLTMELIGPALPLGRRERVVAGFLVSAAWVGLLHALVLATTGRLSTVLHGLFLLTLGQALLLGARRLDIRRRSKRTVEGTVKGTESAGNTHAREPQGATADPEVQDAEAKSPAHPFSDPSPPGERPWARFGLLGLLVLSALLMLLLQGGLGFIHDSLDIVAHVRELTETDTVLPTTSVYSPDPLPAPDPRRGTFHTQLALIARASGADEADVWRLLPILLAPLALLTLYLLAREVLGSSGLALLSACLFAGIGIVSVNHFLQNIAYASRIGWVAGWVGWMAAHRYLRTGTVTLAFLAILTAPALMGIHIFSSAQYLAVLGCLTLAVLISTPRMAPMLRRSLWTLGLAVATTLPLLASRLLTTYKIQNPLFDHPQGQLRLGGGWLTLHPGEVLKVLGLPGLLAVLLTLLLWKQRRSLRGAAVLFVAAWIPFLVAVLPPTFTLLERFHAHTFTFRLLLIVPTALVLAWALVQSFGDLRRKKRYVRSFVIIAATGLALLAHSKAVIGKWSLSPVRRAAWREQEGLVEALSWLEASYPEPQIVLSDPLTSYAVPAYTRHYTITPLHQHSSPTDATALTRMEDAQAAVNGFVGIRETCRILDRYGVNLVLLNQGFRRYQSHYGMFLSPFLYDLERTKFGAYPQLFTQVYDQLNTVIYLYEGGHEAKAFVQGTPLFADSLVPQDSLAPDSLRVAPVTPPLGTLLGIDAPPRVEEPRETLVVHVQDPPLPYVVKNVWTHEDSPLFVGGGVELLGMEKPMPVRAGEPLQLVYDWRLKEELRLPVECIVMLTPDRPPGFLRFPFQPLLRRVWELWTGKIYRFGRTHMPLQYFYPPFLWQRGDIYRDVAYLWIPAHAPPGRYRIHLKSRAESFADNWELVDLIRDEGSLVGPVVGEVDILPAETSER